MSAEYVEATVIYIFMCFVFLGGVVICWTLSRLPRLERWDHKRGCSCPSCARRIHS